MRRGAGRLFLLCLFLLFAETGNVFGAVSIRQTAADHNSVTISVEGSTSSPKFFISSSPNGIFSTAGKRVSAAGSRQWKISGLTEGGTYYVKSGSSLSNASRTKAVAVVTVPAGSVVTASQTGVAADYAEVSWNSVSRASGYEVQVLDSTGKNIQIVTVVQPKVRINSLGSSIVYRIRITPIRAGGTYTARGQMFEMKTPIRILPSKVKNISFEKQKLGKHKAGFSWSDVSAEDYEVEIYDHKGQRIKTVHSQKPEVLLKDARLKMDRFYSIRIRGGIRISSGMRYGAWSARKYFSGGCKKVKLSQSEGRLGISWSRVKGATSYTVVISTTRPRKLNQMKKAKTLKKTSLTLSKWKGSRISNSRIYYVAVIANRKNGKKNDRSKTTAFYYLE